MVKSDNSHQWRKTLVRLGAIRSINKSKINVLDCYAGKGKTWDHVQKNTDAKINVVRIEKEQGKGRFALRGECERYLKKIDLSIFDIVDLDAYGSPSKQLQILFDRKYRGVVCVTGIMFSVNKGDDVLLRECGISQEIIEKIPVSMMPVKYFDMMKHFLAKNGVKKVTGSFFQDLGMQKSYFWFKTEGSKNDKPN